MRRRVAPFETDMRILAGDIGGTKVLLQLAEVADGRCAVIAQQRFASAAYAGLLPMAREFLETAGAASTPPAAACFGIAGPVIETAGHQSARVTNLPWHVESRALAQGLGIARVRLINDFQAVAYAIECLPPEDFATLQEAAGSPRGPRAVLGAGTGLGQAMLVWIGDHYEAIATEGGHVDFAPIGELQIELLQFLRGRYERVSYERILSGSGLANLYAFFRERNGAGAPASPADPSVVSSAALEGKDADAVAALELFLAVYGAQAGNVALSYLATGGVFIAGGIAPKILPMLRNGIFRRAFLDKGRMRALLEGIPVRVIVNEKAGLRGAAEAAARLLA